MDNDLRRRERMKQKGQIPLIKLLIGDEYFAHRDRSCRGMKLERRLGSGLSKKQDERVLGSVAPRGASVSALGVLRIHAHAR